MAKKVLKTKSMEESLWESCNKMRGSIEPSEYKHVVLSLIFLKYASDHFEKRRAEIIADGMQDFADMVEFYEAKNVFYLAPESRWSYIMENAKQNDIAIKIDKALSEVERQNKSLKGALPNNYYSNLGLDITKLASLLDEINKIDTLKDEENDLIGRVYEYFLSKFAIAEGKGKGEFYTPKKARFTTLAAAPVACSSRVSNLSRAITVTKRTFLSMARNTPRLLTSWPK